MIKDKQQQSSPYQKRHPALLLNPLTKAHWSNEGEIHKKCFYFLFVLTIFMVFGYACYILWKMPTNRFYTISNLRYIVGLIGLGVITLLLVLGSVTELKWAKKRGNWESGQFKCSFSKLTKAIEISMDKTQMEYEKLGKTKEFPIKHLETFRTKNLKIHLDGSKKIHYVSIGPITNKNITFVKHLKTQIDSVVISE